MIKMHESFSTRIFLPTMSASVEKPTERDLREFWWFLRAGASSSNPPMETRSAAPARAAGRPAFQPIARAS